jgi:hypothetical protein
MKRAQLVDALLKSENPSIRWKVRTAALGENAASASIKKLETEIRVSPTVTALLQGRDRQGRMRHRGNIYDKWQGAHWALAALADIGYPAGDKSLKPMLDQVLDFWLGERFFREFAAKSKAQAYSSHHGGVPVMCGRHRRCASQQGRALLIMTRLGLSDARADQLVERLLHWQWPDGGWNCDKDPKADTSSFMETITPMRGLSAHARAKGDPKAARAARKAANVFLERNLFKRRSDGRVIMATFVKLHFPLYWHYDVLGGLMAMTELGLTKDKRCSDALDLLEEKELDGGGWPAEERFFRPGAKRALGYDNVDWGGVSKSRRNDWVTADALGVLAAAGRL